MKRILLLFVAIATVVFTGCSKDDDADFKYGNAIYGTWDITHVKQKDGTWLDVTSPVYSELQASATFNSDGTYSGRGYFGNGSGTYKASGNTIVCYVSGNEYGRYTVHSLSGGLAEMTMTMGGNSIDIKCCLVLKKRYRFSQR